jgi:predicted  nucleic acid-binding Zn-ribbon protein
MTDQLERPDTVILERRLRAYELALDTARRDSLAAAQTLTRLTGRIGEMEVQLSEARERSERLEQGLAEAQRRRRAAEQRAYAEHSLREELQSGLADLEQGGERAAAGEDRFAAAAARNAELAGEVARLRRLADEADHLAATARAARERAEERVAELTAELESVRASGVGDPRLRQALRELRAVLARLADVVERERLARIAAERRAEELELRISGQQQPGRRGELSLDRLRTHPSVLRAATGESAGPVAPERFASALARLRSGGVESPSDPAEHEEAELARALEVVWPEELPAEPPAEPTGGRGWLRPAVARLARHDPPAAARLLTALVTAHGGLVEAASAVDGDTAAIVRLLGAGPVRRRLRLARARLTGDRQGLRRIDRLIGASGGLAELVAGGLELDAVLTMQLVAALIEPDPGHCESFTIAHRDPGADPGEPADVVLSFSDAGGPACCAG